MNTKAKLRLKHADWRANLHARRQFRLTVQIQEREAELRREMELRRAKILERLFPQWRQGETHD